MEKNTPHYKLVLIRKLLTEGRVRSTASALSGAIAMGLGDADMLAVIAALTSGSFHKSMTSLHNHRIWQDAYKPMTTAGPAYVNLTVENDLLIVSFKEL